MMFDKNEMLNETLDKFFETWHHTLDTSDFVDVKFLKKIDKYIYKNLVKAFKQIDVYSLLVLKDKGVKLGLFDRLKVWFSGVEPIYQAEKREALKIQKQKAKRRLVKAKETNVKSCQD